MRHLNPEHLSQRLYFPLVLCLLLCACEGQTLYHSYRHTSPQGWYRNDTLLFALPSCPSETPCSLNIGLRIRPRFPYTSLTLVAEEVWNDTLQHRDTLSFPLTDDSGDLQGDGICLLQYEQPVRILTLRPGKQGQLRLRHIMSRETLPHISDAGIRLSQISRPNGQSSKGNGTKGDRMKGTETKRTGMTSIEQ